MLKTLRNAWGIVELRKKIIFTLFIILIYRLGNAVPVPYVNTTLLESYFNTVNNTILGLWNTMSGGSFSMATIFALSIQPYINASIIIQLLTVGIPALERLSKQGEEGRRKIAQITRYVTIALAIVQAVGVIINFGSQGAISGIITNLFGGEGNLWIVYIYMVILYTAGAMLTMWIGERITEYGVGNGISLIIFLGIISTAGLTLLDKIISAFTAENVAFDFDPILEVIVFCVIAVIIFALIVTVDLAERRIPVQYAKQVKGRKMYGGQSTVIPIKISGSGVMPLIFAFAIISLPDLIMGLFWSGYAGSWYAQNISNGSGPWGWVYILVLCLLIFAFSFFYAQIQFNPDDISKSIQQNGGFIPGIRPGKPTAQYLRKISNRITLFGAIFLSLVAFVPSFAFSFAGTEFVNVFSTTGILIVVSVALEFDKQLQSQLMMKNYKGFLK